MGEHFVNELYNRRNELIILGLTGSTGSGCTTITNLIYEELFIEDLPEPKKECYTDNEERKYRIAYKYFIKQRENYKIIKIEITDIICSFLLECGFSPFQEYINNINLKNRDEENDEKNGIPKFDIAEENEKFFENIKKVYEEKKEFDNKKKPKEYLDYLNSFKRSIKKILLTYSIFVVRVDNNEKEIRRQANLYTYLFQNFGDNIRSYGNPYPPDNSESEIKSDLKNIYSIPEKINEIIDDIKTLEGKKIIIIDAIRNPFEIFYFRDRYKNFFLFNISKTDRERRAALIKKGMCIEEIEDLERQELIKMGYQNYCKVNVLKCIELSGIHIFNSKDIYNNKLDIKKNLIKYLALIMHPGIVTPTDAERCMKIANDLKVNSGCLSLQVGTVITDDQFNIKSTGWNTVPNGQIPCNLRNAEDFVKEEDEISFSKYELENEDFNNFIKLQYHYFMEVEKINGSQFPQYCFKDAYHCFTNEKNQVHTKAIHAEEMAFLNGPEDIKNGKLFTTSKTCELCSKKAYHKGIEEIYYINQYSGISEDNIINCGVNQPKLIIFTGITGLAYDKLYMRIISSDQEQFALTGFSFKQSIDNMSVKIKVNHYSVYVDEKNLPNKFLKASYDPKPNNIFKIVIDDKLLVLKQSENYVCADLKYSKEKNDFEKLNANRTKIQTWEKFRIKFLRKSKKFALQSLANSKFIKLDDDNYLKANAENFDENDSNMIFEFERDVD